MKRLLALAVLLTACGTPSASLAAYTTPTHTMFWMNVNGAAQQQVERIHTDAAYIAGNHIDVGVLAELNPVEARAFAADAPGYGLIYSPDPAHSNNGNGVFYDRAVWRLIGHQNVATYSWAGERVITVVPFLRDAAGTVVAVFPLHNPYGFARYLSEDMRIEARTALAIHGSHPAWRAVVAGDFNLTDTARKAMTAYGLAAASPSNSWTPVDQAFTLGLHTSGYRFVRTTATDHQYQFSFKF